MREALCAPIVCPKRHESTVALCQTRSGVRIWKGMRNACSLSLRAFPLIMLFIGLVVGTHRLSAQVNTADVVGTVTDPSGAVVTNATVTLKNVDTGITRTAPTSTSGEYLFTYLQVGTYQVNIEAKGFKTFVAKNISLSAGDRARVDARLQLGGAAETISVSASTAPALDTDTSAIGSLIPGQILSDMPLNGRNVTDLVRLAPGVSQGNPQSGMVVGYAVRTEDSRPYSAYVANGQQSDSNNNMLDGSDNNEALYGIVGVRPSLDAIQEVKVQTNLYSAEVGRTSGGAVDVITKSGTNAIRGSLYEYLRNDVLDSRLITGEAKKAELRQNQFGGSLGGPIKKDKTFFFGDYEGFRQIQGKPVTALVPTPKMLTGDFSELSATDICTGAAAPGPPGPVSCLLSELRGEGINSLADAGITSFDPIAVKMLSLYPAPNVNTEWTAGPNGRPVYNYVNQPNQTQYITTFDGRIDHNFSSRDILSGHYDFNDFDTLTPTIYPGVTIGSTKYYGGAGQDAKQRVQKLTLDEVHIFRPTLLLDLKASYLRYMNNVAMINPANAATNLGFPCDATSCINSTIGDANFGLPIINEGQSTIPFGTGGGGEGGGGGGINLGDNNSIPFHTGDNTYQYVGSLTWTRGNHSVKTGASLIRRQMLYMQSGNGTDGLIYIDGSATGNYVTDFLLGAGSGIARGTENVAQHLRNWEPYAYVQDDWRVSRWLTLNLGARWELITPYTEENGYIGNFDVTSELMVSPYMTGANHSNSTAGLKAEYHDFAPRIGFSASLKHNMVVRGGFGMTYFNQPSTGAQGYTAPFQNNLGCGNRNTGGQEGSPCVAAPPGSGLPDYGYFTFTNTNSDATDPNVTKVLIGDGTPMNPGLAGLGYTQFSTGVMAPYDLKTETALIEAGQQNYPGMILVSSMNNVTPYLEQWSLQVEKQYGSNVITLGYVGNAGRHLHVGTNINQYSTNADFFAAGCWPPGPPQPGQPPPHGYLPDLQCSTHMMTNETIGTSNYQSMQLQYTRRFAQGLTSNVNFTWAHALSLGVLQQMGPPGGVGCPRVGCLVDNPTDHNSPTITGPKYDYGNSDLDLRHRIGYMTSYEVPFANSAKGIEGVIAKGWTISGSGYWQTGNPYSVNANVFSPYNLGPGGGLRANQVADPRKPGSNSFNAVQPDTSTPTFPGLPCPSTIGSRGSDGNFYAFNPCAYTDPGGPAPPMPNLGNQKRNQVYGPHSWTVNASAGKEFPLHENYKLAFRAEAFNLTNTTADADPAQTTIGSSQTGLVTRTGSTGRQFQFGLKLSF